MNIEGVPEGYQLLRIGNPEAGEFYISTDGLIQQCHSPIATQGWAIVRKIEKPKRYRPFANAEEFKAHRDWWIKAADGNGCWRICGYSDSHIYIDAHQMETYLEAFGNYVFEDGLPFGIEVTE